MEVSDLARLPIGRCETRLSLPLLAAEATRNSARKHEPANRGLVRADQAVCAARGRGRISARTVTIDGVEEIEQLQVRSDPASTVWHRFLPTSGLGSLLAREVQRPAIYYSFDMKSSSSCRSD
jgi:hypothetical protein